MFDVRQILIMSSFKRNVVLRYLQLVSGSSKMLHYVASLLLLYLLNKKSGFYIQDFPEDSATKLRNWPQCVHSDDSEPADL